MSLSRLQRRFITSVSFLALGGAVAIDARAADSQESRTPENTEPRSARSVSAVRALIVDLEAQLAAQREQLERTETRLKRARALLDSLQDGEAPANRRDAVDPAQERPASLPAQSLVATMQWKWDDRQANPDYCAQQLPHGYQAEAEPLPGESGALTIRVRHNGQPLYSWKGHSRTVFVLRDGILYYADFSPTTNGCAIVAQDLNAQQRLWRTELRGTEAPDHSRYRNAINLRFEGAYLVVYGNESFGRYIELVDPRTGKTVGHRQERQPGRAAR